MPLAEGVSARTTFAFYASGVINGNVLDDPTTAPGAAGGKALRRVSLSPSLKKATYASAEIRTDRQVVDFRHGVKSVAGTINGELSPATYFDFIEATHRDTRKPALVLTPAILTSIAANSIASTFIVVGDPVAAGLRVGQPFVLSGSSAPAANDGITYVIVGFSGAGNTNIKVSPAPVTQAAAIAFTLTSAGASTIIPSTGIVSRKVALEVFDDDVGTGQLFVENRVASYKITVPASGMATVDFTISGRSANSLTTPYFTDPTPETSTGIVAAVNGALLLNGVQFGTLTALDFTCALTATAAEVVGQDFSAEIFLGRAVVTGSMTAYLDGNTLLDAFALEQECQLLVRLNTGSDPDAPSIVVFMPRIKLSTADVNYTGEAGQSITAAFQALKYVGAAPGVPETTLMLTDSEVAA